MRLHVWRYASFARTCAYLSAHNTESVAQAAISLLPASFHVLDPRRIVTSSLGI
jgi:hypothetical protein